MGGLNFNCEGKTYRQQKNLFIVDYLESGLYHTVCTNKHSPDPIGERPHCKAGVGGGGELRESSITQILAREKEF